MTTVQPSRLSASLARSFVLGIACLLAAGFTFAGCKTGEKASAAPTTALAAPAASHARIGVYDSRAVALAGLRTGNALNQDVQQLQKQLKDAEAAGDTRRAQQIRDRGAKSQMFRHQQGFSTAPVDDILARIKDKLPTIASEAGVDVIVARTDFSAPGVQTVDVTDRLVREFAPDPRTLTMIDQVRKQKPITMLDALLMEE